MRFQGCLENRMMYDHVLYFYLMRIVFNLCSNCAWLNFGGSVCIYPSFVQNVCMYFTDHTLWRHQMETFSALLAICAGNSPVPGEFPTQRPVTRSFDAFFDLRLSKRLSKQSWCWWFDTPSRPLWRHRNVNSFKIYACISQIIPGAISKTCTWFHSRRHS